MSDFIDIGPQCFASNDLLIINYKGDNYYKACDVEVNETPDHTTHCVKRVGHSGVHEDYFGKTKRIQIKIERN